MLLESHTHNYNVWIRLCVDLSLDILVTTNHRSWDLSTGIRSGSTFMVLRIRQPRISSRSVKPWNLRRKLTTPTSSTCHWVSTVSVMTMIDNHRCGSGP